MTLTIDLCDAVEESYKLLATDPVSYSEKEGIPGDVWTVRNFLALLKDIPSIPTERHGELLIAWVTLRCVERWARMLQWCYTDRGILDGEMAAVVVEREGIPLRLYERVLSRAIELVHGVEVEAA